MMSAKKHHFYFHYASLLLLLSVGYLLFFINRGYPHRQFNIIIAVAFFYVIWGIIHHYLKGDLHVRIVLEYSLIALLSAFIIRGAILR